MPPELLDTTLLLKLAGPAAFKRGQAYARDGAVWINQQDDLGLQARASGSDEYALQLRWRQGALEGTCTCPVGERGAFCKHQVAAALLWRAASHADSKQPPRRGKAAGAKANGSGEQPTPEAIVEQWLQAQSPEQLRALVKTLASQDRDQWRELVARARFACAGADTHRKAITDLIGRKRVLDYRASREHAHRLRLLIELLNEQLQRDPAQALDLAGHALPRLFVLYEQSDDSSGALGDVLGEVAELHRQAAQQVRPGDSAFAKHWLKLVMADQWGLMGDVAGYAAALGSKGLALVEKQLAEQLDALPAAKPGSRGLDKHAFARLHLHRLLQQLAHHGGDVDAMLARRERSSLARPDDYLELHALCRAHGRERIAVQWLERGVKAFPNDVALLDALAQSRIADGFGEEALALAWRAFEAEPEQDHYVSLRDLATRLDCWPHWRERALTHVRALDGHAFFGADALLMQLHLAESDLDSVLALLPKARLPIHLWAAVAEALSPNHPEQALPVYRTLVRSAVEQANSSGYRNAVGWLRSAKAVHQRLGDLEGFSAYLGQLRASYKAKRSFIAQLDKLNFPD